MILNDWLSDEVCTVQDVSLNTELFYEHTTGYIYCPFHRDDSSMILAQFIALVDDYGNIQPTLSTNYRLQKDWKGYKVINPIAFCCQLWNDYHNFEVKKLKTTFSQST